MKFLSQINVNSEYTLPIVDGTNGQVLTTDGNGAVYWSSSVGATNLNALTDVELTSPSTGQILRYEIPLGGSVPVWRNVTPGYLDPNSSINALGDVTITSAVAGQILQFNGTFWINTTLSTVEYVSKVQHTVKAGVAITKGQAVYVTTSDGTNMIVGLASNAAESTSSKVIGLAASNAATNDQIFVVTEGLIAGLNTSTATAGDPVWLGTNGNLIFGLLNKPVAPAHLVYIGVVTRVQQNNGEIFVNVQNGFELNEIHDALIVSPTAGQLLRRDSDNLWKNWTPNFLTAEADTLATVTARGATTTSNITVNGAAFATSFSATGLLITNADTSGGLQPDQGSPANKIYSFRWAGNEQGYIDTDAKITFAGFKTPTGTASQFLKANGTIDSNTYLTTTSAASLYTTYDYVDDEIASVNTYVGNTFVPKTRTLTINGTAFDLSANRSWTISTAETDTLATVTGRGNTTTTHIGVTTSSPINLATAGNIGTWIGGIQDGTSGWSITNNGIGFKADNTTYAGIVLAPGNGILYFGRTSAGGVGTMNSWLEVNSSGVANFKQARPQHNGSNLALFSEIPTNLNQLVNGPGYITGYTETDTLASVTGRGATTTNAITVGGLIVDTNTLVVDATNDRVGIGRTSPLYKIDVAGNARFDNELYVGGVWSTSYGPRTAGGNIHFHDWNGNVRARINTVAGVTSVGNRKLSLGILDINSQGTPEIKINTKIPFALGAADFTVNIKGFQYGSSNMVSLSIGWHYYLSQFYNETAISNGSFSPTITLGVEPEGDYAGCVVIHLSNVGYWPKLYVESVYSSAYADDYVANWSWSDVGIDGLTSTTVVPYKPLETSITGNAAYATNAGNSITTSQTNFTTLTLSNAAVATQAWVQAQGYATSFSETDTLATVTARGASTSTFTSLLGGSKIVVQNGNDGGNTRGIFMWASGDSNWGIYMSTASAGVSLAGGTAVASIDGRTAHHIRFRAYNATGNGFIWENDSEQCLMSLTTNTGNLYTRGQIYAGNSTSNVVWHAGNDGSGSGLDADLLDGVDSSRFVYGNSGTRRGTNLISNWNQSDYPDVAFLSAEAGGSNAPNGDYTYGLQYSFHRDGASYRTQITTSLYSDSSVWVRNSRDSDVWTSWKRLWHSGDFTSTNVTNWNTAYGWGNHSGLYLPLSGGTLSGNLNTNSAIAFRDGSGGYSNIIRAAGYPSEGYTSSDKYWMEYSAYGGHHFVLNVDGGVGGGQNTMDDFVIWQGAIDGDRLLELTNGGSLTIRGTFTEQSSIRYKENVKSIPSVSQKVEKLDAVSYNKIGSNQEEIGLIAEDVAELFPEVVKYDNEGRPDGVNYSRLSVILLKAVQELSQEVNELKKKLN